MSDHSCRRFVLSWVAEVRLRLSPDASRTPHVNAVVFAGLRSPAGGVLSMVWAWPVEQILSREVAADGVEEVGADP